MGNLTSCCFSFSSQSPSTKVFDSEGGLLKQVHMPITAAELMFETPGHVVCNIESCVKSRRIIPLKADDELQMNGGVYMMVQANRINCIVSESEIEIIKSATSGKSRSTLRRGNSAKVLPDQNQIETTTTIATATTSGHLIRQYWIPALEPIAEVC